MLPINFLSRGSLEIPAGTEIPLVFPGVRGKIKRTITSNGQTFKKGSLAIIQPLNKENPQRFKLTAYQPTGSSRNRLPEDQRNISIDNSTTQEITLESPEKYIEYGLEQYQKSNAPIFSEGSPSIEDINQARVPDCFFLASIAAILAQPNGASFIRSMFRQHDDGTTTVRLFDPNTGLPKYIRVENAYIVDKKGSLNNNQGLWVDILENAAATVPEFFDKHNASMSGALKGGTESRALTILTGSAASENYIEHETSFLWDIPQFFELQLKELEAVEDQRKMYTEVFNEIDSGDGLSAEQRADAQVKPLIAETLSSKIGILENLFGEDLALDKAIQLLDFYTKNKEQWDSVYATKHESGEKLLAIIEHFSKDEANGEVIESLKSLYHYYHVDIEENIRRDNQQIFSGIYSPEELAIYKAIEEQLASGEVLTAGTPPGYNGERVLGLRAPHAYTITGVVETKRPSSNDSDSMQPVKMVRIRNPWGKTGRLYLPDLDDPQQIVVKEAECAGTFDIELKDFCRYYESYTNTVAFNNSHQLTHKREALATKIPALLKSDNKEKDSIEIITDYFHCVNDFVDVEMSAVALLSAELRNKVVEIMQDALEPGKALAEFVNANQATMMNVFQTSDSNRIVASLQYWYNQSHNLLTDDEKVLYQNSLVLSAAHENTHWKSLTSTYQKNASIALGPINATWKLVNEILDAATDVNEQLQDLIKNEEPDIEQPMRGLFIQIALLKRHFLDLEQHRFLLSQHGMNLDNIDLKLKKFDDVVENLKQTQLLAAPIKLQVDAILPPDLSVDEFTNKANGEFGKLVSAEVSEQSYHEVELVNGQETKYQGSNPFKRLWQSVMDAISDWKKSRKAPGYSRFATDDAKYYGARETIGFFAPDKKLPLGDELKADTSLGAPAV